MSRSNVSPPPNDPQPVPFRNRLFGIAGGVMLVLFVVLIVRTPWVGYSDFDQVYIAGVAWRKGFSPYDGHLLPAFGVPNGPTNEMLHTYYYSPICAMLAAPLTFLSFPLTVLLWKVIICGTFLYGCWRFIGHLPRLSETNLRLFLVGITALAGSTRWCLKQLQPSLLVVGLLLLFACFLVEKNRRAALICGLLIGIKLTFLLPALGLLLILRDYRLLGALLGGTLLLNVIALVPTGIAPTLQTYRHAMGTFEDMGKMTRPDARDFLTPYLLAHPESPLASPVPDVHKAGAWAGEQIHYPFLVSGLGIRYPLSRTIGQLLTGATLIGFCFLWERAKYTGRHHDTEEISTQFAALMALSLLVVYHQRYDVVGLIPGFFVALSLLRRESFRRLSYGVIAVVFLLCYVLTGGMLDYWHGRIVVPHGWLFLVPICGYLTLTAALCLMSMAWQRTTPEKERKLNDNVRHSFESRTCFSFRDPFHRTQRGHALPERS